MSLKAFIKSPLKSLHSSDGLLTWAKWTALCSPLVSLVFLLACGLVLAKWNLDEKFECVSSFLEVMIALNVSCSYGKIRDWLNNHRNSKILGKRGAADFLSRGMMGEGDMKKINDLMPGFSGLQGKVESYVKRIGLVVSVLLTVFLVVGLTDPMKPFVVFAAFPVIAYLLATWLISCFFARAVRIADFDLGNGRDPLPDWLQLDYALGCTGPVAS